MGMHLRDFEFCDELIKNNNLTWNKIKIGEMGNQKWRAGAKPAKLYFLDDLEVLEHISFDRNNKDGALPFDLKKDLPTKFHNRFDIVTNHGTAEHVDSQYNFFRNMHLICKLNGFMIHGLPYNNNWSGHCKYFYDEVFINELANLCKYEILKILIIPEYYKRKINHKFILVALKKINNFFIEENSFNEIYEEINKRNLK